MQQRAQWCWTNNGRIKSSFSSLCRSLLLLCYGLKTSLLGSESKNRSASGKNRHTGWDTSGRALQKRGNGMFIQLDCKIWILHVYRLRAREFSYWLWVVWGYRRGMNYFGWGCVDEDIQMCYFCLVLSVSSSSLRGSNTTTTHPGRRTRSHTHTQTNTGSYSESSESAL